MEGQNAIPVGFKDQFINASRRYEMILTSNDETLCNYKVKSVYSLRTVSDIY